MSNPSNHHILNPLKRVYRHYLKNRVPHQKRVYNDILKRVREEGKCRILFLASSLPMWRYDELTTLLLADKRFEIQIGLIPFRGFTEADRRNDVEKMANHFSSKGFPFRVIDNFSELKREFKPDMIVYPQPYEFSYEDVQADWLNNRDLLLIHTPYSVPLTRLEWYINNSMHNLAWRLYLATEIHRGVSRDLADNRGENVRVVGEPKLDLFAAEASSDPWKQPGDGKKRKRLIWAPHFSVVSYNMFDRPDFNWTYRIMRGLAEQYADRLQIAFKPHPRLKAELYQHPEWGKERTDEFYAFWENSPTTQLETGDYIDLFKTSDAMIHNCGSFTAEYLMVNKPAGYTTGNLEEIKADMNDFGRACQDAHYTLTSAEDIRDFIDRVVLGGEDNMSAERERAINLLKAGAGGQSVARNIYNDLTTSLFD